MSVIREHLGTETSSHESPYDGANAPQPTPGTIAHLLSATSAISQPAARATAASALMTLIRGYAPAHRALATLEQMAEDAGLATDVRGWSSSAHMAHEEFDQLLALGTVSKWADPRFLLDPDGSQGAELGIYLRIARARLERQEEQATAEHLAWLDRAAAREETEGSAERRAATLVAWPFNVGGDMDGPGGEPMRMILGALEPIELRFRAEMAALMNRIEATPDDLRRARSLALRLLATVHSTSLRMGGLAQAVLARIYLTQAQVTGKRLPGLEGRPILDTASIYLDRAGGLLRRSQHATPHDLRGLAALRSAIEAQQAIDDDGRGHAQPKARDREPLLIQTR